MSFIATLHQKLPGYQMRQSIQRGFCRLPGTSKYPLVAGYTWLPPRRLKALEHHIAYIERANIAGDVVECGVAAGGSAALLGLTMDRHRSDRVLRLYDTFDGLPPPTKEDPDFNKARQWTGQCRGSLEEVKALFSRLGLNTNRIRFVPGLFQNTLELTMSPVAMAHLDGDWYDSTMTCLRAIWPALTVGGVIQLDDYGEWQGCRKAVDEFFAPRQSQIAMRPVDGSAIAIQRLTADPM
jgi:O-methyltransferase